MGDTKEKIDRWEQFNLIVDDESLGVKEKGLLLILFRFVNYKTGYANPSRELLKKLYGTKRNETLDNVLTSLINKKYISRESGKGCKNRTKYRLLIDTENGSIPKNGTVPKSVVQIGTENGLTIGTENGTQKEKIKEKEKNIDSPSSETTLKTDEEQKRIEEIKNRLKIYPDDLLLTVLNEYREDNVKRQVPEIVLLTNIEKDLIRISKDSKNNIKPLPKQLKEKDIYKDLHFIDPIIDTVKITEEQYQTLINKHGEGLVNNQILALDNYIVNGKGKKYKDHYRALNTWCNNSNKKNSSPSVKKVNDEALEKYLS